MAFFDYVWLADALGSASDRMISAEWAKKLQAAVASCDQRACREALLEISKAPETEVSPFIRIAANVEREPEPV